MRLRLCVPRLTTPSCWGCSPLLRAVGGAVESIGVTAVRRRLSIPQASCRLCPCWCPQGEAPFRFLGSLVWGVARGCFGCRFGACGAGVLAGTAGVV